MSDQTSYREIVRSTVISGLALTANLATSVVRTKVAALILGPAGVGLIGIYGNLITVVSTIAALGMGNAGTRQIA
ncbi:MAG: O-antigen translocase, partial [Alcaligenaceae bacterium]